MVNVKRELRELSRARNALDSQYASVSRLWPKIIDDLLFRRRLSLKDYAKKLGISATYLSLIGSGKTVPSPKIEAVLTAEYLRAS